MTFAPANRLFRIHLRPFRHGENPSVPKKGLELYTFTSLPDINKQLQRIL